MHPGVPFRQSNRIFNDIHVPPVILYSRTAFAILVAFRWPTIASSDIAHDIAVAVGVCTTKHGGHQDCSRCCQLSAHTRTHVPPLSREAQRFLL